MKRVIVTAIGALMVLSFFGIPAEGTLLPTLSMPDNISIEVEFKEASSGATRRGRLGPYEKTRGSKYTKQHIMVSDGLTATIRVGEDVPYIEYYTRYLTDCGYVEAAEIVFIEVGTSLTVTPRIMGSYIEISLTPQISYISDEERGVIDIKELSTTVLAMNGQPISVGGLFKDSDFTGHFFKTKSASNLDIVLTPRIQQFRRVP